MMQKCTLTSQHGTEAAVRPGERPIKVRHPGDQPIAWTREENQKTQISVTSHEGEFGTATLVMLGSNAVLKWWNLSTIVLLTNDLHRGF